MMLLSPSSIEYAYPLTEEFPWVISLGEVCPQARFWVGEKAYRLALLAQAGFQVPRGYCITVSAYQRYLACQGQAMKLPRDLSEEVLRIHRMLELSTVAVRSSTLDEDQPQASAAGVYPSHLNIRNDDELLNAIANCFDAANCKRVKQYRRLHRNDEEVAIAVLVQAQVEASSAGILFTADPISGSPERIHVNAILGLGEPLTSGELTPDHYVLDRSGNLLQQSIVKQPWLHGVKGREPVPQALQDQSTLCPVQLAKLHQLAQRIEEHEAMPVDIEFSFDEQGLQVLQVRPIAGAPCHEQKKLDTYISREKASLQQKLAELRQQGRIRQPNSILSNGNIAELLPSPTPMSFGLFDLIFAGCNGAIAQGRRRLGYQVAPDAGEGLFQLVAGQPFFVLEIDARTYDTGLEQPISRIHHMVARNTRLANYPEVGLYEQLLTDAQARRHYPEEEASKRLNAHAAFNRLQRKHAVAFTRETIDAMETRWRDYLEHNKAIRLCDLDLPQLIGRFHRLVEHMQQETCKEFVSVARLGFYFYDLCRVRLQAMSTEEQDFYLAGLFQGLQGTAISDQYRDLEKLADGRLSMSAYLQNYGHLSTNELEISLPRYHENPAPLLEMIRARAAADKQPERAELTQRRKRLHCERTLRAKHFPRDSHSDFWRDLRLAQRFLPLREQVKYFFLAEYDLVRATLLEIESRLNLGADNVFYLRPQEVGPCSLAPKDWHDTISRRRQDHQMAIYLARQHRVPEVLFENNLEQLGEGKQLNSSNSWRGQALSPGYIEGTACVVETLEEAGHLKMELGHDKILIIPSLNLGLSALLGNLGGLIVETGGVLAHSACQARERGIPAAVLPGATLHLKSGDRICLDGSLGLIRMA